MGNHATNNTSDEENAIIEASDGHITLFEFTGPLSFGAAADLGHQVREKVREHSSALVLDFTGLTFVDVSAARAVETIAFDADEANKTVYVAGMNKDVAKVLAGLNADHYIPHETRFEYRIDALKAALAEVTASDVNQDTSAVTS